MQGKARLTGVNGRAPLARALIVNYHPGLMSPGRSARRRREDALTWIPGWVKVSAIITLALSS